MPRVPTSRPPTRPGEVLVEEFFRPMEITQAEAARATGIPLKQLAEMANGQRALTPSVALRLARYLGTTPEFWTSLQHTCDLYDATQPGGTPVEPVTPITT